MNTEMRKKIVACSPFFICGYVADKLCWLFRQSTATEPIYKFMETVNNFGDAFKNPLPSIHPIDLCFGIVAGFLLYGYLWSRKKNAKNYRQGQEYGSARWGNAEDIKPYMDEDFYQNILLTETERLMMSGRPKNPKYARNKNVMVIGANRIIGLSQMTFRKQRVQTT